MAEGTSKENPDTNPITVEAAEKKPESTGEELKGLKELIAGQQLEAAVTKLVDLAAQNENIIPQKTIDDIIERLSPKEEQDLKNFLEGHTEKFILKNILNALGKEVTGITPDQAKEGPAGKIGEMIRGLTRKLQFNGKLGSLAATLGFNGTAGKESVFLANFLTDTVAGFIEQFALYRGGKTVLDIAKKMRIDRLGITGADRKTYETAYDERAKQARKESKKFSPPEDLAEAVAINAAPVKKETTGYNKDTNTLVVAKDEKKTDVPKKGGPEKTEAKVEKATA